MEVLLNHNIFWLLLKQKIINNFGILATGSEPKTVSNSIVCGMVLVLNLWWREDSHISNKPPPAAPASYHFHLPPWYKEYWSPDSMTTALSPWEHSCVTDIQIPNKWTNSDAEDLGTKYTNCLLTDEFVLCKRVILNHLSQAVYTKMLAFMRWQDVLRFPLLPSWSRTKKVLSSFF